MCSEHPAHGPLLRRLRRAVLGAPLCAAIAAAALATGAGAAERPLSVRAVGDSYASGEGAKGRGWIGEERCHRSSLAAAADAAARLNSRRATHFESFACTGATTSEITAQLARLPRDRRIDALTISAGGNDVRFATIVKLCIAGDCTVLDGPERDGPVDEWLRTLRGSLADLLAAVPTNVTNVFVTEYPDPTIGWRGNRCGSLPSPSWGVLVGITEREAVWASRTVLGPLNAVLADAVAAANARAATDGPRRHQRFELVTGIAARFATHGYCTGGGSPAPWTLGNPRFISTLADSVTSQGDADGTMHPNDLGQRAIADVLVDRLGFLAEPLRVQVAAPSAPVVGSPSGLEAMVTTSRGTPVAGATVRVDGTPVGETGRDGRVWWSMTFATAGKHAVSVDHDPFPVSSASVSVRGRAYTVIADPAPIPVGRPVALTLRAADSEGASMAGTFVLTSGSGTATMRSGDRAVVDLAVRHEIDFIERPNGKPPKKIVRVICPTIRFIPDDARFETRDVPELVACTGTA